MSAARGHFFSMGNGFYTHGRVPAAAEPLRLPMAPISAAPPRRLGLALTLFLLTVVSTLFVGLHLTQAYEQNQPPYTDAIYSLDIFRQVADDPRLLLSGWPFAATLLGILLAHELGHYFACRHYGIVASYPYFLPAPTLIGTMGAFIRIQSPIVNRRALFDVGIAGPLVGFILAVPALAIGVAHSKIIPGGLEESAVIFGNPPLVWFFAKLFWPEVSPAQLMLHPVARAAWVGLFATALNLLPVGQLDGGHIVYAVAAQKHRLLSRGFLSALLVAGLLGLRYPEAIWPGWLFWGGLLLLIGLRHPAVLDPGPPLDRRRQLVALLGLVVFALCFTPVPFHTPFEP
ncbi:MAG: site-2 protease family protein [Acidobacteria bacterium]|nr:site-2 protease family protein [Acidobacteriota bacterium]